MVTELVTCNVLLPLISRVSDPDWLNQTIVDVITRTREPQEISVDDLSGVALYRCELQQESWTTCRSLSSSDQADLFSKNTSDLDDLQSQSTLYERDFSENSMFSLTSAGKVDRCHPGLLTPCKVNCCSLPSGHSTRSSESKMISLDSLIPPESEDSLTGGFCDCGPPTNFCNMIPLKDDEDFGCFAPLKNLGPKVVVPENSQWPAGIAQEKSPTCTPRRLCLTPCNFDTPSNQATPVSIQNVQISGTVTAKEQRGTGTHPYTLYTVKVTTLYTSFNIPMNRLVECLLLMCFTARDGLVVVVAIDVYSSQ